MTVAHWIAFLEAFLIVIGLLGAAALVEDCWQRRKEKRKETGRWWLALAAVSFGALILLLGIHFAHAAECPPQAKIEHAAKHKARHHARPVSHPYFWPYGHFLGFRYLTTQ